MTVAQVTSPLPRIALSAICADCPSVTAEPRLTSSGRTPYVLKQDPPGRQHWPRCFSSIIAGAGIKGGNVYGRTNRLGEFPTDNPVRPEELAATIYRALEIPINDPQDASGISRSLTSGQPIMDLFG